MVANLFGSVKSNHTKNKWKRNSNHSGDSNGNLFFVGHFVGISEQRWQIFLLVLGVDCETSHLERLHTHVAKKSSGSFSRVSFFCSPSPSPNMLTRVFDTATRPNVLRAGCCGANAVVETRETAISARAREIIFIIVASASGRNIRKWESVGCELRLQKQCDRRRVRWLRIKCELTSQWQTQSDLSRRTRKPSSFVGPASSSVRRVQYVHCASITLSTSTGHWARWHSTPAQTLEWRSYHTSYQYVVYFVCTVITGFRLFLVYWSYSSTSTLNEKVHILYLVLTFIVSRLGNTSYGIEVWCIYGLSILQWQMHELVTVTNSEQSNRSRASVPIRWRYQVPGSPGAASEDDFDGT